MLAEMQRKQEEKDRKKELERLKKLKAKQESENIRKQQI